MARKSKYDYYNDVFKAAAVELAALRGIYAQDVAEILDIHPVMLYCWKKEYRDGVIMKKPVKGSIESSSSSELKRLKKIEKEYDRLQMRLR